MRAIFLWRPWATLLRVAYLLLVTRSIPRAARRAGFIRHGDVRHWYSERKRLSACARAVRPWAARPEDSDPERIDNCVPCMLALEAAGKLRGTAKGVVGRNARRRERGITDDQLPTHHNPHIPKGDRDE